MSTWSWIWTGILGAGVVIETVALTRRAPGKPVWRAYPFGLGLAALSVWFFGHVMFGWGP